MGKAYKNFIVVALLFALLSSYSTVFGEIRSARVTPTVIAIQKALPSVVNISTEKIVDVPPQYNMFQSIPLYREPEKMISLGSGCIIDKSGIILTNAHVVNRATQIKIILSNGMVLFAKEIASDELNDLALLQIVNLPKNVILTPITFAKAGDLLLGETVVALGNPYGLGNTITQGVLSATHRALTYNNKLLFSDLIQTDTAIFPGNSGGPLINIDGDMIGITMAVYRGKRQGIGFAIPVKRIENTLAHWLIPERHSNISLGLIPGVKCINGEPVCFIQEIIPNSPAAKQGLRTGDILEQINGRNVVKLMPLLRILWHLKKGERIAIKTNRKTVYLKTKLIQYGKPEELVKWLGISVQQITPTLAKALRIPFDGGVILTDTTVGQGIIKRGDILIRLNGIPIYQLTDISKALHKVRYGKKVSGILISIYERDGQYYYRKKKYVFTLKYRPPTK